MQMSVVRALGANIAHEEEQRTSDTAMPRLFFMVCLDVTNYETRDREDVGIVAG